MLLLAPDRTGSSVVMALAESADCPLALAPSPGIEDILDQVVQEGIPRDFLVLKRNTMPRAQKYVTAQHCEQQEIPIKAGFAG